MTIGITNSLGMYIPIADGTTILDTSGTLSVGTIAESKVTNLTSDLALKVPYVDNTQTFTLGFDTTTNELYYEI